jgi:glycosyltransferase involved in cell wall biosynthesis
LLVQNDSPRNDVNAPSVSVVVPTLNNEATIRKCLESIGRVDYPKGNLDVILLDCGSTDETIQIAHGFPVRVVVEPGKLRGATYNRGLSMTRSPYVAYVDGDGYVADHWLREGMEMHNEDTTCAAVYFPSEIPRDATFLQRAVGIYQLKGKLVGINPQEETGTGANGVIYRRAALVKVGGFDERLTYGQERELDTRLNQSGYRIKIGKRDCVFHYPRSTLRGFFTQNVEGGMGYARRFLIAKKSRMLFYIILRSLVSIFPLFMIMLYLKSSVLFEVAAGCLAILSAAYLTYVHANTRVSDPSLILTLPLLYLSCVASLTGYVVGFCRAALRSIG